MWQDSKNDVESGTSEPLYPMMLEAPELRWAFIRKVYSVVAIQLILTVVVATVVVSFSSISTFFTATRAGWFIYMFISVMTLVVLCPLWIYSQRHPVNLILLGVFTICFSISVGLICAYSSGKVILEAFILTAVVVASLTLYTFWAVKRGQDFSFLGPFLFSSLVMLMVFGFIQIFFPLGRISEMIYACVGSVIFCGYIVYDTDNLIKRYTYDEYIWASVSLYVDIINLFVLLLRFFRVVGN